MRNLLALVGLVVVVAAGVGYYKGWYTVTTTPDGNTTLKIDKNAAKKDVEEIIHGK